MPDYPKGNWSKAAIGGLVLLNLVLLVFLVLRDPPGAATAVPAVTGASGGSTPTPSRSSPGVTATARPTTPTPTAPATRTARPTPTATTRTPTPTPTKSSTGSDSSTRILAVNSARVAWRAVFGPCPTDPDLEVSRDGGRTWRSSKPDLRSVSRLRAYSDSSVFAVGGAEGCNPQYVASGGPGERWLANKAELGDLWYRVPRQADRVHAPGGQLSRPCGKRLLDFAGLGDLGAAALCGDGALRTTRDSGRSWRDVAGTSAGLALGADERTYALAMRRDGCDGVAVVLLGPAARSVEAKAVRCARLEGNAADELGVGVRGQVVWLWQGSKVAVSTDGGRTWKVASGPDSP